ncbi:cytochrome P450 [Lophium mytilinum]|uniref:Cytochrome P450 n=1 Tax=Lophium mytilinum TaxID=390894 RepID=A0A6A6QYN8_9PEZI|nr:cytochrome P450 [Lophium mytilinum]
MSNILAPVLSHPFFLIAGSIIFLVAYQVHQSRTAGLNDIPGPWLAKYTNLWRLLETKKTGGDADYMHEMHKKYGDVVRVGPHAVNVADPANIPAIYGNKARLHKPSAIEVILSHGRTENIVTIRNPEKHGKYRRPIAGAYSLSSLLDYEVQVDEMLEKLFGQIDKFTAGGKPIDIARWLFYYAYDVVGYLSFGSPIGFLDSGKDAYNLIKFQGLIVQYVRHVIQMPILHKFLAGNPLLAYLGVLAPTRDTFVEFSEIKVADRLNAPPPERMDMLSHFIASAEKYPDIMTPAQITSTAVVNMGAGALGSSKVLQGIVTYLLAHPEQQDKLYAAMKEANVSYPINWKQIQEVPFLEGLVKEGVRLHLSVGVPLIRESPPSGLRLVDGSVIPAGIEVGMKPYVVARRQDVWGPNAEEWEPERWMRRGYETETEFKERRAAMERGDLSFGHGARTCIGKNIAMLQVYKVVSNLVYRYRMVPAPKVDGVGDKRSVFAYITKREGNVV